MTNRSNCFDNLHHWLAADLRRSRARLDALIPAETPEEELRAANLTGRVAALEEVRAQIEEQGGSGMGMYFEMHRKIDDLVDELRGWCDGVAEWLNEVAEEGQGPQPGPGEIVLTLVVSRNRVCLPASEISVTATGPPGAPANTVCCCVTHGNDMYIVLETADEAQALVAAALDAVAEAEAQTAIPTITLPIYDGTKRLFFTVKGLSAWDDDADGGSQTSVYGDWYSESGVPGGGDLLVKLSPKAITELARATLGNDWTCEGAVPLVEEPTVTLHSWYDYPTEYCFTHISRLVADGPHIRVWGNRDGRTDMQSAVRENAARITHLARAVWPDFSCPGCVDPFVVLHSVYPKCELRFTKITKLLDIPSGTHVTGRDGPTTVLWTVGESEADIIAAATEAGVPCCEEEAEVPTVTLQSQPGGYWQFANVTRLEAGGCGCFVHGIDKRGEQIGIEMTCPCSQVHRHCILAGIPCPPEEPEEPEPPFKPKVEELQERVAELEKEQAAWHRDRDALYARLDKAASRMCELKQERDKASRRFANVKCLHSHQVQTIKRLQRKRDALQAQLAEREAPGARPVEAVIVLHYCDGTERHLLVKDIIGYSSQGIEVGSGIEFYCFVGPDRFTKKEIVRENPCQIAAKIAEAKATAAAENRTEEGGAADDS